MACFNRVLLVEDDPITSLVCERIIKLTFFSEIIITLNNGEEALVFIKEQLSTAPQNLPEVIFLDVNMPLMNGWELLDELSPLCASFKKTPLIYILSLTVDPEDQLRGASYPFVHGFLSKPLTKSDLEKVSQLLY